MAAKGPLLGIGRTAEVFAWNEDRALKLFLSQWPSSWADEEARTTRFVNEMGVPSPKVYDVIDVEGRRGIIYERISGPSFLGLIRTRPASSFRLMRTMAALHADVHTHPAPELRSQREGLIYCIEHAPPLPDDLRAWALAALARLPGGDSLCHGDFHPDNIILAPRGPIITDWSNARRGNPAADVARTVLMLRMGIYYAQSRLERVLFPIILPAMQSMYWRRYTRLRPMSRHELNAWMPVIAAARLIEGIKPEEAATLAMVRAGQRE